MNDFTDFTGSSRKEDCLEPKGGSVQCHTHTINAGRRGQCLASANEQLQRQLGSVG